MWYLPPECFVVGPTAPRISGKVSHLSVTVTVCNAPKHVVKLQQQLSVSG
jgi:hypothetical protein